MLLLSWIAVKLQYESIKFLAINYSTEKKNSVYSIKQQIDSFQWNSYLRKSIVLKVLFFTSSSFRATNLHMKMNIFLVMSNFFVMLIAVLKKKNLTYCAWNIFTVLLFFITKKKWKNEIQYECLDYFVSKNKRLSQISRNE